MDEEIVAYIRSNRDRYTGQALRQQLLAAGHPAESVDAALAAEFLPAADAQAGTRDLRPPATLVMVVAYVVTFVAVTAMRAGASYVTTLEALLAINLIVIGLISFVLVWRNKQLAAGVAGALVVGLIVPFVLLVIVAGTCLALTPY
jgi:hypothetical protein